MQKLTKEDLEKLKLFESITEIGALNSIEIQEALIFIVKKRDFDKPIAKSRKNLSMLSKMFKRNVQIISLSEDIKEFLNDFFNPLKILKIKELQNNGKMTLNLVFDSAERGLAIGKNGVKIKTANLVAKKYFPNISEIRIF